MAAFIFGAVLAAILTLHIVAQREWRDTDVALNATHRAGMTLEQIVYGYAGNAGLRAARADTVVASNHVDGWTLSYQTPDDVTHALVYDRHAGHIRYSNTTMASTSVVLGDSIASASITGTPSGMQLSLTVSKQAGQFASDAAIRTFVYYRNTIQD